jgi:hypothetical protein
MKERRKAGAPRRQTRRRDGNRNRSTLLRMAVVENHAFPSSQNFTSSSTLILELPTEGNQSEMVAQHAFPQSRCSGMCFFGVRTENIADVIPGIYCNTRTASGHCTQFSSAFFAINIEPKRLPLNTFLSGGFAHLIYPGSSESPPGESEALPVLCELLPTPPQPSRPTRTTQDKKRLFSFWKKHHQLIKPMCDSLHVHFLNEKFDDLWQDALVRTTKPNLPPIGKLAPRTTA